MNRYGQRWTPLKKYFYFDHFFFLNSLNCITIVIERFQFLIVFILKYKIWSNQNHTIEIIAFERIALEIDSFGFMKKIKLAINCINFFMPLITSTHLYLCNKILLRVEHFVSNLHVRYNESCWSKRKIIIRYIYL